MLQVGVPTSGEREGIWRVLQTGVTSEERGFRRVLQRVEREREDVEGATGGCYTRREEENVEGCSSGGCLKRTKREE